MATLYRFQLKSMLKAALAALTTFRSIGAMGANIHIANSTLGNAMFVNALRNGARFQKTGQPGVNANRDATTGLPTEPFFVTVTAGGVANGAGGTFNGSLGPGTYNWSYTYVTANGAVAIATATSGNTPVSNGITGFTTGVPVVDASTTTVPFTFTVAALAILTLSFTGAITDYDFPIDGQLTTVGGPTYRNVFLSTIAGGGHVRLLDFWGTNGRLDVNWADRTPNYTKAQMAQDASAGGYSWELGFQLFLEAKAYPGSLVKKLHINIPVYATMAYVTHLATLATSYGLGADQIEWEYGNEPWNSFVPGRFHGYEWAAMNSTQGIANYELTATYNNLPYQPQSTLLYQGPGTQVAGMAVDATGLVTVTLKAAVNSYVDYATGSPFIVDTAQAIVSCSTAVYNKGSTLTVNTSNPVTISVPSPTGTTFTYSTGVAGTATSFTGVSPTVQMFFNVSSPYLADNLSFTIANLTTKWSVRNTYLASQAWYAVRPKATYRDLCYLNVQEPAGMQGGQKTRPFAVPYAIYLDGSGAWLSGLASAFYLTPVGTQAAYVDLYDVSKSTSLYNVLNGPGTGTSPAGATSDNGARGLVYLSLLHGWRPLSYEAGPAMQTASAVTYAIRASQDVAMELLVAQNIRTVLQNGVQRYMVYHSSPRIVTGTSGGNGQWQDKQFYDDSVNAGDANYSAKWAGSSKFNDVVLFTNVNGNDATTLDVSTYQNATELIGNDAYNVLTQATTGVIYWGTGSASLTRNMDWVWCCNTAGLPRQIFVDGNDVGLVPCEVWAYPPDQSGGFQIGSVNIPAGGSGALGTSVVTASSALSWTPPTNGPWVIRLILQAGQGTNTGIRRARIV